MSRTPPSDTAMRVADLSQNADHGFALRPTATVLAQIAMDLDLSALRKLSFVGAVTPVGKTDWQLTARLGATVVQPCVATLEPVTTRIDIDVKRQFVADYADPEDPEVEMPEDETTEHLGVWIDPDAVMVEALSIAVPDYPRKSDAHLGEMIFTKPGQEPMSDEQARPFAGLADLQAQLKQEDDDR